MAPTRSTSMPISHGRPKSRPNPDHLDPSDLAALEAGSHRPEVQEIIREAIRRGTIRVLPVSGSETRVKIIRVPPNEAGGR